MKKNRKTIQKDGLNICFLGPDGIGKGTIIQKFLNKYNAEYFHLKPRRKSGPSNQSRFLAPHSLPQYSNYKSWFKLMYLYIEYICSWLVNCVVLRDRRSICVFDRYIDDILVDPKRFRLKGNNLFRKLVVRYLPKPDIYFVLNASADEVYRRKPELSLQEIDRQLKAYDAMIDGYKYVKINAERPIAEVLKEVENHIYEWLNTKKL